MLGGMLREGSLEIGQPLTLVRAVQQVDVACAAGVKEYGWKTEKRFEGD